jgi:hypothetical protein
LEEGQFIPWETFLEFNLSLGQTEEENKKVYQETRDWRITYNPMSLRGGRSSRRSNLPLDEETASPSSPALPGTGRQDTLALAGSARGCAPGASVDYAADEQRLRSGRLAATSKEIVAYAGASHWQFTAYKSTLQQFLPFDMDKPMGQVRQLDKRMNDAGLLRLMVSDPLAMNMSNTLGYLRGELGRERGKERGKKKEGLARRVLELGPIKKMLLAMYNKIFSWYYS